MLLAVSSFHLFSFSFSVFLLSVIGPEIQGAGCGLIRDLPDPIDFPEHGILWIASNYKTAS
jgi:hypothetical protein